MQIMSEQIDQLATALAKAQAEFAIAEKNQKNPFFKSNYASFESIVVASRQALTKHGLSVVQDVYCMDDGNHYLITLLLHASGQWIKSKARHNPVKADVQSLASYNTYLKRMCYTSLVGVITADEDDDGNSASIQILPKKPLIVQQASVSNLNSQQEDFLLSLPIERQQKICNHYNVEDIIDLTYDQYKIVYGQVNKSS